MTPSSLKRFFTTIRIQWTIFISLTLLGLSIIYCLAGWFVISRGYSDSYLITTSFLGVFNFVLNAISFLQVAAFLIWITFCFSLIIGNRKYWWAVLIFQFLTTVIFILGTLFGMFGNHFKTAYSITYQSNSFHLNHIYDWDDGIGHYSLLKCDQIDLNCKQIYISQWNYPKIDTNAQIKIDEITKEISVTVEDKTIFSQPLE